MAVRGLTDCEQHHHLLVIVSADPGCQSKNRKGFVSAAWNCGYRYGAGGSEAEDRGYRLTPPHTHTHTHTQAQTSALLRTLTTGKP